MAALLAAASALSTPAAHAVGLKAAKGKQAAGKGGLFNPAGRTEELAGAESKRKKEVCWDPICNAHLPAGICHGNCSAAAT